MTILDTDHVSVYKYAESERAARLHARLQALPPEDTVCVSIVTVEEQMRGWLASIAKERQTSRQVNSYRELGRLFVFFRPFPFALFDDAAAARFDALRASKIRIGTMDLKIALTALVNDAPLLTANRRDFEQVPGLRFENWLE